VGQAASNVVTSLNPTSVTIGGTTVDTATVSGTGDGTPTGTVKFQTSPDGNTWTPFGSPVTLAGGTATSPTYTAGTVGTVYFQAVYSGDGNYTGNFSRNTSEPLTVNPPVTTSTITPTGTTCNNFTSGNAQTLSQLNYSVKGGKISQVDPGSFFYFDIMSLKTATNIINVNQTNLLGWIPIQPRVGQVTLYNSTTCTVVSEASSINTTTGNVTMTTTVSPGSYVAQVGYSSSSLVGQSGVGNKPTNTYTFKEYINGIFAPGSQASIKVVPK
jgi:hypothetical protein